MDIIEINSPLAPIQEAMTEFEKVSAGLTELSSKYKNTVYPVASTQGMDDAKAARLAIREPRYVVGRLLAAAKKELAGTKKNLEERAEQITDALLVLEEPIDAQIKAEENRKANEKRAKEEAEVLRISILRQRLAEISAVAPSVAGGSADQIKRELAELSALEIDASWDEFVAHAADAKDQAVSTLITMHAKAVAAEEAQAVIAAQQAELQALRQQIEAQRLAQQAELAKQAEAQRLANLASQLEAQRLAKIDEAAKQAEAKRVAIQAAWAAEPEPAKPLPIAGGLLAGRQALVSTALPKPTPAASEPAQAVPQAVNLRAAPAETIGLFDVDFQPSDMEIVRAVADRFCVSADLALHWICSVDISVVNNAIAEAA